MTDLAKLHDDALAYSAKLLEQKLHSLRLTTSAIGRSLYEQYEEKLAAVRIEQERRSGI